MINCENTIKMIKMISSFRLKLSLGGIGSGLSGNVPIPIPVPKLLFGTRRFGNGTFQLSDRTKPIPISSVSVRTISVNRHAQFWRGLRRIKIQNGEPLSPKKNYTRTKGGGGDDDLFEVFLARNTDNGGESFSVGYGFHRMYNDDT